MHLGPLAGVVFHPVGQQILKPQVFQKAGAVADAHRDGISLQGQGAPVQKAVDGDAVPLHLLKEILQGFHRQAGIGVTVVDHQLIALIIGL